MRFFEAMLTFMLLTPMLSRADTLASIGPTYQVAEQSALSMIANSLKAKQKSGELIRLEKDAIRRSIQSVRNMPPVPGISAVMKRAQRFVDPTVHYAQAVMTAEGQIVVPAGARINPLDIMTFSKTLVFFDGRDKVQVKAVRQMLLRNARVKPILVAGSWLELSKAWQQQVFFDQRGILSRRFDIKAVPSVVRQEGRLLLLEEIPAKDLS